MSSVAIAALTSAAIQFAVLIAVYASRDNDTYQKFVANPKAYGSLIIAIANASTIIGGGMFLAVSQIGYDAGVYGIYLGLTYFFGLSIFAAFCHKLGEKLDGVSILTLNQLIEQTYGKRVRVLFSLVNAFIYFMVLSAQFVAVSLFFKYLTPTYSKTWLAIPLIASAVNLFSYPILGGFRRDVLADIFQFIVVAIGSMIVAVAIYENGNLSLWPQKLEPQHWTGMTYGLAVVLGTILFVPPIFFVRTDMWQRVGAAKDSAKARLGFFIAAILSLVAYTLFTLAGMAAYATGVKQSPFAIIDFLSNAYSGALFGVVLGAFLAAVLSTADTFLNNLAIHTTSLFWVSEGNTRKALWRIRLISAVLLPAAIPFALFVGDIVDLFLGSFSLLLIFFMTVIGIWLPRWRSESAALWSISLGLVAFFLSFFGWDPKEAFVPAFLVSTLTYLAICSFDVRRQEKTRLQSLPSPSGGTLS
jgi:Na+/proline symporter